MWPENLSWQYTLTIHIHAITAHMFAMSLSTHATLNPTSTDTHQQLSSQLAVFLRLLVLQSWSCCWWLQPLGPSLLGGVSHERSWCSVRSSMDGVLCDHSSLSHYLYSRKVSWEYYAQSFAVFRRYVSFATTKRKIIKIVTEFTFLFSNLQKSLKKPYFSKKYEKTRTFFAIKTPHWSSVVIG